MRRIHFVVLAIVCTSVCGTAHGQDRETARLDFQAGVAALEARDFAAAEAAFTRSLAGHPTAAAQCNLALTYDQWGGHGPRALAAYESCAERDASGQYREHAAERATELRVERDAALAASQNPQPSRSQGPIPVMETSSAPTMTPTRAPTPNTVVYRQEPPPTRGRGFFWLGVASTVIAGGALIAGLALSSSVSTDVEALESAGYPRMGDRFLIPENDPGRETLRSAQTKSTAAVGLYIGAAITGALAIAFFGVQASGGGDGDGSVAVAPLEGGAIVTARLSLE